MSEVVVEVVVVVVTLVFWLLTMFPSQLERDNNIPCGGLTTSPGLQLVFSTSEGVLMWQYFCFKDPECLTC